MPEYPRMPLGDIAPKADAPMPASDVAVWNLSLEDVETGTGEVRERKCCLVNELGSAKCSFDSRHVLYSKLRPYLNKVVLPDQCGVGTSELIPLLPDPERLHRGFLAYYLRSPEFVDFAVAHSRGANLPRVAMRALWAHLVPIPPLEEQMRIVRKIQEALQKAQEIRKLRRGSLAEAAALEESVFSDFVMDFMKNAHVSIVPLGDILVRAQYGSSSKANTDGEGVPILRMGNIQNGHLDVSDLKHFSLSAKELTKYRLSEGDILFNRTNSLELVGKAATFTGLKGDWVFASYLIRLEVDRSKALPEYVTAVINSRIGRDYVYRTARRAIGMVNINAKQIQRLELPLPPLADQEWLVGQMRRAKTASDNIRRDLGMEAIEALPDAILHKAFAGEL